jgi:hypothetical protein
MPAMMAESAFTASISATMSVSMNPMCRAVTETPWLEFLTHDVGLSPQRGLGRSVGTQHARV